MKGNQSAMDHQPENEQKQHLINIERKRYAWNDDDAVSTSSALTWTLATSVGIVVSAIAQQF